MNKKEAEVERAAEKYRSLIPKRPDRIFRVFLEREVFPNEKILFEAISFTITNPDGSRETVRPDQNIFLPERKKLIVIEETLDRKNGTDPKERYKRVMHEALLKNDNNYYDGLKIVPVVLYGDTFLKIQQKYPEYNFFKSEKKTNKKKDKEESLLEKNSRPKIIKTESGRLFAPVPVFSGRLAARSR